MLERLIAAAITVWIAVAYFWDSFYSIAALFTFIPASYLTLFTIFLITMAGLAVFRLLDFDNWGVEDALSVLYLGSIALYGLTGNANEVLVELVKNAVGFSVAFLIGIYAAGGRRRARW